MAGRLLLDENLSPRLAAALSELFPGSVHVRDVALKGESDIFLVGIYFMLSAPQVFLMLF